jgi:hypothetical protein
VVRARRLVRHNSTYSRYVFVHFHDLFMFIHVMVHAVLGDGRTTLTRHYDGAAS